MHFCRQARLNTLPIWKVKQALPRLSFLTLAHVTVPVLLVSGDDVISACNIFLMKMPVFLPLVLGMSVYFRIGYLNQQFGRKKPP